MSTPEDEEVKRLSEGALHGDVHAQFALGLMYETGESVAQDNSEAVKWYQKAAEHGEANAQFHLALMFVNGRGVPQNDEQSVQWFRKAAERGSASGQYWMGWMHQYGEGVAKVSILSRASWFSCSAFSTSPFWKSRNARLL